MRKNEATNYDVISPMITSMNSPTDLQQFEAWFNDEDNPAHSLAPAVDIEERATEYRVEADLPGMRRENILVESLGRQLVIRAERRCESPPQSGRDHRERFYGSYTRCMTLPPSINAEQISASYEEGVLRIVIPKLDEQAVRRIEITSKSLDFDSAGMMSGKMASADVAEFGPPDSHL